MNPDSLTDGRDRERGDDTILAIRTTDLTKRFGDHVAVDHLDLAIPQGHVYGFLGVEGLHGEEDVIARADIRGIVGCGYVYVKITVDAPDAKAILLKRVEVVTACNEVDISPNLGEAASEVSTDATSSVDRDLHQ